MSKFKTDLYPNRKHYLSDGTEVAFAAGEAAVPDAFDTEMRDAGFEMITAPVEPRTKPEPVPEVKRSHKKKPTTEE